MNKKEFINRLLVQFMSKADVRQAQIYSENLEKHLKPYWDFDVMYEKVCMEWTKTTPPTINFLTDKPKLDDRYKADMARANIFYDLFSRTKDTNVFYGWAYHIDIPVPTARANLVANHPDLIVTGNNREEKIKEYEESKNNG